MYINHSIQNWLYYLRRLVPVTGVIHIGKGSDFLMTRYSEWAVPKVILIESDKSRFNALSANIARHAGWSAHRALISDVDSSLPFSSTLDSDANEDLDSGDLNEQSQDVSFVDQQAVRATTLPAFLAAAHISSEGFNWVVVECLSALSIFKGAAASISGWDVVIASVSSSSNHLPGQGAAKEEIDAYLGAHNFRCIAFETEDGARIGTALYVYDKRAALVANALKHHDQTTQQTDNLRQPAIVGVTGTEQERLIEETKSELKQLKRAVEEQSRVLHTQQLLLEKQNLTSAKQTAYLTELVRSQHAYLMQMEKGMASQFTKELSTSIKQIESYIGIDAYLSRGELLPSLHGWPVSPDFALYLIALIEANKYDCILEFGSGASTLLMARAVLQKQKTAVSRSFDAIGSKSLGRTDRANGEIDSRESLSHEGLQSDTKVIALQPRIISFEHDKRYFDESVMKLKQGGVDEIVELNHTPLRDYITPDGQRFLYYSCEERIAALSVMLQGQRGKLLVVVDGPPGTTGKKARYPALPIILQYLTAHCLDVLLDDTNREDEHEILESWARLLNEHSLPYEKNILPFEKGACLLAVRRSPNESTG